VRKEFTVRRTWLMTGGSAELVLVEDAIAALFAEKGESHDRLVPRAALDLAARSAVVVHA
jgi:hypothetical protein